MLDDAAIDANISFVAGWVAQRGLELMPHGKTTMAPQLWRRQLDAGATGITVATPWQLGVAVDAGIRSIMLANQLTDPNAIRWLASGGARETRVWSWMDDVDAVAWTGTGGRWQRAPRSRCSSNSADRAGGRARGASTRRCASRSASPLRRRCGWPESRATREPSPTVAMTPSSTRRAATSTTSSRCTARLAGLYDDGDVIVTAGGSAYPDVVADAFAAAAADDAARFVLRSGAYITHDEGYYRSVSPFEGAGLRPAARGIARVVSHPEPGLVLVDAGKRDFPYDEGLPIPLFALTRDGDRLALEGATTTKLNDQHTFVRLDADPGIRLGDLIVFGLSHPCTMFDKWRLIPVVDSIDEPRDADRARPRRDAVLTGSVR